MSDAAIGGDPAARLLDLLERARGVPKTTTLKSGWSRLVGGSDIADLLPRIGDALRLPGQIREALLVVAPGRSDLLQHLPSVETLLVANTNVANPNAKWAPILDKLDPSSLVELRYASVELNREGAWSSAAKKDVDEALTLVRDLIDTTAGADVDRELKHFLLERAREIRDALERYRVVGADAIVRGVESAIGGLVARPHAPAQVPRPVWKKFVAVLTVVSHLVIVTEAGVALADQTRAVLKNPAGAAAEALPAELAEVDIIDVRPLDATDANDGVEEGDPES